MIGKWITNVAVLVAIAALGLTPFIANAVKPVPFDEWYEDCLPEEADWHVVVHMGIPNHPNLKRFEAYYRKRSAPPFESNSWFGDAPQTVYIEELCIYNGSAWAGYACGGGGGHSEHGHMFPSKTPNGLQIDFDHERNTDGIITTKVKQTIVVPFRRDIAARQGELTYRATWKRVN